MRVSCSSDAGSKGRQEPRFDQSVPDRGDFGEREPGNHSLPADLLKALPFPIDHAAAYDRRYLARAVVEQYDGDLVRAWDAARWRLEDMITSLVNKDAGVLGGPEERWPRSMTRS